ncbi:MAG: tRNA adenosine(34) deaminase TadA [Ruminococcus sp.]|nr:tRNA adenosine(34) deaminase TadA [Ruminococcus sp.]
MSFTPEACYMRRALELAHKAAEMGEVPVGAVVVYKLENRIIGEGFNRRECNRSPLAHAELIAIDQASRTLGGWRLVNSVLYVTLEPCPMCAGAILQAQLDELVFGTRDPKGGAVYSVEEMFALPYHWKTDVYEGILQEECADVLTSFFRALRAAKKAD